MIFSQIKTWGLMILGAAAAVFYALFQTEKAKRYLMENEGLKATKERETAALDAYTEGLKNEAEISRGDPDPKHFTK